MGHYLDMSGYPSVTVHTVAANYGSQGYTIATGATATQSGGTADADFIDSFSNSTYTLDVTPANISTGIGDGFDAGTFDTVFVQAYIVFSF